MDPWLPIIKNLKLSGTDERIASQYLKNPEGRLFLPVSEILRRHNLFDEAMEMLLRGVQKHPRYAAARVALAKDMMQRGMFKDAFSLLSKAPSSLKQNLIAQKVMFKLSVLLNNEYESRQIYAHLRRSSMLDSELQKMGEALTTLPFSRFRKNLQRVMQKQGVPFLDLSSHEPEGDFESGEHEIKTGSFAYESDFLASLAPYRVVSFKELSLFADVPTDETKMDPVTLAEVYEEKSYFKKSLAIYEGLLEKSPKSLWLVAKVAKLRDQIADKEQQEQEKQKEKDALSRLVSVDKLDHKLQLLHELLWTSK